MNPGGGRAHGLRRMTWHSAVRRWFLKPRNARKPVERCNLLSHTCFGALLAEPCGLRPVRDSGDHGEAAGFAGIRWCCNEP